MAVKAIPDGYHTVTPFITVEDANGLLEFLGKAFGAERRYFIEAPGGKVGHAEVTIGDSVVMVADPDERDIRATVSIHLYVEDVDRVFKTAVDAGASVVAEPETHFYGDRSGAVTDRWGNRWYISSHVEDVSEEELKKRMAAMSPA